MHWAGIDYDTRHVDVVRVDCDTFEADWERWDLAGADAFERARSVRTALPAGSWEETLAVGIEEPAGQQTGKLLRVQGAVLARLPSSTLVTPLRPSEWRRLVGIPGDATKAEVRSWAQRLWWALDPGRLDPGSPWKQGWPQDAWDAWCMAHAVRVLVESKGREAA